MGKIVLLRTFLLPLIDKLKKHSFYLQNAHTRLKSDPNFFWVFINIKNKCSKISGDIFCQGVPYKNPQLIVNTFIKFFGGVYSLPDAHEIKPDNVFDISCEAVAEREILNVGKKFKPSSLLDRITFPHSL